MNQGSIYRSRFAAWRHRRRAILRAAAIAAAPVPAAGLLGCNSRRASRSGNGNPTGERPAPGGTFNTYNTGNLSSLDPQTGSSNSSAIVTQSVMGYLLNFRAGPDPRTYLNHEIENGLASSVETPDGLTWTIKLRPNVRFHNIAPVNGRAVEAEDVKASFVRAYSIPQNAFLSLIPMIDPKQIETPALDTVVFKLRYAYGPFRGTLAGSGSEILPREALAGSYDPAKVAIGSGPFTLDSYTPDTAIVLRRNPSWIEQGRPYVDTVRATIIPDAAQQMAQFTTGNLDELRPSAADVPTAQRTNPNATVLTSADPQAVVFMGHMNDPASPFRDMRIRRALSMALDRGALEKAIFNGQFMENGVVPAALGKWALTPDQFGDAAQYYKYDPAAAKRLVDESGASSQLRRYLYPSNNYGPVFNSTAEAIVSMLNAVGFKIQLVPIDYNKDFIGGGKGVLYGNYPADSLFMSNQGTQASAEDTLIANFTPESNKNKPQVNDPVLTAMLEKMRSIQDDDARLKAALDIQRYAADKVYLIPLPNSLFTTLVQPWVHNYFLDRTEGVGTFPNLWLKR